MTRTLLFFVFTAFASPVGAQPVAAPPPPLRRWLDFPQLSLAMRGRAIDDEVKNVKTRVLQERTQIRARLKFDAQARYTFNVGLFTGTSFVSGWNSTGVGTGDAVLTHSIKQLFVTAQPVQGLEFQLGSVSPVRGESTEISTYDEDAYVTVGRAIVRRRQQLFFDDITVSVGNLGEPNEVSVFDREYDGVNYYQAQVSRRFSPRLAASFDFSRVDDANTWRPSALIGVQESRIVDQVRVETYFRDEEEDPAAGFVVLAEKQVLPKFRVTIGYADIDPAYGDLNADRYFHGKRLSALFAVPVTPELNVQFFYGHEVGDNPPLPVKMRSELVVNYNFIPLVRRTGWF